jgi:DNA polymerase-3 subunit alpha
MADPAFVHLHVHSSYSLLEGALPIARLAELAKADRQPALALTDTDNMFGALEFSDKMAGSGIQPIIGCALAVDFADQDAGPRATSGVPPTRPRIVLLAAREAGYRSLMRLNSRAFLETPPNEPPHIKLAWLEAEAQGLIALSGGPSGPLDAAIAAGQGSLAAARCAALLQIWPMGRAFRWLPATSRFLRPATITRPMMRSSVSPKAATWPRPTGAS